MNHPLIPLIPAALLTLAAATTLAQAQSFPIAPLSDSTYPTTDPAFDQFDPSIAQEGTMQRVGDINNDGREDLIVIFINQSLPNLISNDAIWIYLQNESGTFDQPYPLEAALLSTNTNPIYDFIIHDHNNDGLNDIIFATLDITIPLIASQGGFNEMDPITTSSNIFPPRIRYTDTNNDGFEDLVIWSQENLSIDIRLSDGKAQYSQALIPPYSIQPNYSQSPNDICFSDVDADNDMDILITDGSTIYWMEKLNGTYSTPIQWIINTSNYTRYFPIIFADVNADALVDIVFPGRSFTGGEGYGFYLAPFTVTETRDIPFFEFPDFTRPRSMEFVSLTDIWTKILTSPGDLDGDGTDDLILKPFVDSDTAWRITDPLNINGRFGISADMVIHGDGSLEPSSYPSRDFNTADAYIDVNNDHALDRITPASSRQYVGLENDLTTNDHQGIMLWAALGNPFLTDIILNEQDTLYLSWTAHLTHADLDYDGEPEILTTWQTGSVKTIRRNNDDLWSYDRSPRNSAFTDNSAGFRSIVAQLDSDNRTDLLSLRFESYLIPAIFINIDLPEFGERYDPPSLNESVDFDQLLSDQDISFSARGSSFAVADIDSDGDNDIVIRGSGRYGNEPSTTSVLLWLNDGNANFTPGPLSTVEPYAQTNIHLIELLDHDNDGDPDLVSIQGPEDASPTIAIYENDGSGNFTPAVQVPIHGNAPSDLNQYWIETNDLDLDGFDDIQVLVKNTDNQSEVVILFGSPTGISTQPVYLAGKGAAEVHSADLDGNGLIDIYTCSYESNDHLKNSISIMFQTAPRQFLPSISISDMDMAAVDALDMNRDGGIDLIGGTPSTNPGDLRVFYSLPAPCPADFNLDRTLDFSDIELFIRLFAEHRPIADFNNDNRFNFFDVSTFITTFQSACP